MTEGVRFLLSQGTYVNGGEMQEEKVQRIEHSLSEAELYRRREKLEAAMVQFESNLLMDIRLYLKKFKLERLLDRAEGIWHEVVNTALKNASNYNPECSAKAWLRQAAFYAVQHLYRDMKKQVTTITIGEAAQHFGFVGDTEETSETELFDYLEQKNVKRFFKQEQFTADEILSLVNESASKILQMRFVEDLSTREIAANFGISEGAADVRLSRAKGRLRKEYLKQ